MQIITLLTDFGQRDGYTGMMKGVIWGIAPHVQIVDITHDIAPQDVLEATRTLGRVAPYFPDGTIHVVVVDPGVGTRRRAIAAEVGRQFFVGPDNGLMTGLLDQAESWNESVKVVHLLQPRYWLPNPSSVFHGRDIFAPVAAHLSKGASLEEMGEFVNDPVRLNMSGPKQPYPGIGVELRRLADQADGQAALLADELRAIAGNPDPSDPIAPRVGRNHWERLTIALADLEALQRRHTDLALRWDVDFPAAAATLARLTRATAAMAAVVRTMVVRSDPHAAGR